MYFRVVYIQFVPHRENCVSSYYKQQPKNAVDVNNLCLLRDLYGVQIYTM